MATNNRRSGAPAKQPEQAAAEKPVATPAQEAFMQIVQLVHLRVPLTGPERDEIQRMVTAVAAGLGMNTAT